MTRDKEYVKVVVYVRGPRARMLRAEGHDPAAWVRDLVDRALSRKETERGPQ